MNSDAWQAHMARTYAAHMAGQRAHWQGRAHSPPAPPPQAQANQAHLAGTQNQASHCWSTRYDMTIVGLWWHAALRNIQSEHQGQVNEMHTNVTARKPWPARVRYHDGVMNAQYVCFSLLMLSQDVCGSLKALTALGKTWKSSHSYRENLEDAEQTSTSLM